jgi:hypothetical protein
LLPVGEIGPPSNRVRRLALGAAIAIVVAAFLLAGLRWRHQAARNGAAHAAVQNSPATRPGIDRLTNEDIIRLKKVGFNDSVIITKMRSAPGAYKLTTDDLFALKRAGISDRVISVMLQVMSQ